MLGKRLLRDGVGNTECPGKLWELPGVPGSTQKGEQKRGCTSPPNLLWALLLLILLLQTWGACFARARRWQWRRPDEVALQGDSQRKKKKLPLICDLSAWEGTYGRVHMVFYSYCLRKIPQNLALPLVNSITDVCRFVLSRRKLINYSYSSLEIW